MKMQIATHCWSFVNLHYAVFLRAQLSSLVANPPHRDLDWGISVVYDPTDHTTVVEVERAAPLLGKRLTPVSLPRESCWRRCIGRDLVAKQNEDADLVWFTDCDYLFHSGCLELIWQWWETYNKPTMIWPTSYSANKDVGYIDNWWEQILYRPGLVLPNPTRFTEYKCPRAIGGVQIVAGEYLRQFGYLRDDPVWQQPSTQGPFPDAGDIVTFRRRMEQTTEYGDPAKPVKIMGTPFNGQLHRMRHTVSGYRQQFQNDGRIRSNQIIADSFDSSDFSAK